jgi:pyruvate formate lyase activating enzyme
MVGTKTTVSDLMDELEKDTLYYDQSDGGVTFSGGEPLLQIDFIEALLNCCVDKGIHTAIDTSGYVPKDSLSRVIPLADLFLYDIKMMDSNRHLQHTGVSNQRILANLKYLADAGANIIPRIPIIPGINDQNESIFQTGKFLQSLGTIKEINILPYHRTAESKYARMEKSYPLENLLPAPEENTAEIAWILENFGFKVKIGG